MNQGRILKRCVQTVAAGRQGSEHPDYIGRVKFRTRMALQWERRLEFDGIRNKNILMPYFIILSWHPCNYIRSFLERILKFTDKQSKRVLLIEYTSFDTVPSTNV